MTDQNDRIIAAVEKIADSLDARNKRDFGKGRAILPQAGQVGRHYPMTCLRKERLHMLPAPGSMPGSMNEDKGQT
jgi:hypothetical protein